MTDTIYFVRFDKYVKIGWTKNADRRVRSIANTLPGPIEVLGIHAGTRFDEARLHLRFDAERQRGEWFTLTDEIARTAANGWDRLPNPEGLIAQAIERAGSQCRLARAIGCLQATVSAAARGGRSPYVRARVAEYMAAQSEATS